MRKPSEIVNDFLLEKLEEQAVLLYREEDDEYAIQHRDAYTRGYIDACKEFGIPIK